MARKNTNAELWSHLSQFGLIKDSTTGDATTLNAAVTEGASTGLGVTTSTALSTGNLVRVGDASDFEVAEVTSLSTSTGGSADTMDIRSQLAYGHDSGDSVAVQAKSDMGAVSDDGVQPEVEAERNAINVATQRHRYHTHTAHTNFRGTVNLENLSAENLMEALGIDASLLHGAGTAADPTVVDWTPADLDTIDWLSFYATGALKDGRTYEVQWFDCSVDPTKTLQLARGQDAPAQLTFDARHVRFIGPTT